MTHCQTFEMADLGVKKTNPQSSLPEYCQKRVLILGCGNILFGDDGFGPAVVDYLQKNYKIPDDVGVVDVGTSAREILFTIALCDLRPEKIIIIDAIDAQRLPGKVFEIDLPDIPESKINDFSLHQSPTSNLLKELQELCKVKVNIFVAQVENIPEEVSPGLSKSLIDSIPKACKMIMKSIEE